MVKTNSNFVELGTLLPDSVMVNVNSTEAKNFYFSQLDNRHLLIMFICAHCPFVKHLEKFISQLTNDIGEMVQTVAISSNDITTHPGDSPENLRIQAKNNGWDFPYLFDHDQSFAKKLKAACTPDFYLFSNQRNSNFSLFYHGQLDKSRPSNDIKVTGNDLIAAVKALSEGKDYKLKQLPSLGCNIKWTPGNEPKWFN
tara:strand:- start:414 stop:1007 length:594 start_codon:yes stop_codon:yes gene_type:complete